MYFCFVLTITVSILIGTSSVSAAQEQQNDESRLMRILSKVDAIDEKVDSLGDGDFREGLLDRIEEKLDKIDVKLEVLTSVGGTYAENGEKIHGSADVTAIDLERQAQLDAMYQNYTSADLISIERRNTEQGNRFTVRFTKNAHQMFYHVYDTIGPVKFPDSVVEEGGGVWAVSFTCNNSSTSGFKPWIVLGDHQSETGAFQANRHAISLQLTNDGTNPVSEELHSVPILEVFPAWEVVYRPGHDVNFTASVSVNDDNNTEDWNPHISDSFYGIDLSTGKINANYRQESVFTNVEVEETHEKISRSLTVRTTIRAVSGYLQFSASVQGAQGSLVQRMSVHRFVTIRPSNQTHALPPGYLALVESPYRGRSQNGNELIRCFHECYLSCAAVGESISELTVKQVLPDGSLLDVPTAQEQPREWRGVDTVRELHWSFQDDQDSGDSDGITTFQCTATDASRGKVVTQLLDVLAVIEVSIDEDMSSAEVVDDQVNDQMDPQLKTVIFNCAVRGRPVPAVTFSGGSTPQFGLHSAPPDNVTSVGDNVSMATKAVTMDVEHLTRYMDGARAGLGQSPYCQVFSPTQARDLRYSFEIPDTD